MATAAKGRGAESGEPRSFAPDEARPAEGPHRLLPGEGLHGVPVFDRTGERIGSLEDVAIDEATGKVAYAVLRHGGFLGLARRCRPIPWSLVAYDPRRNAYVVRLDRAAIEQAPSFQADVLSAGDDEAYRDKVHGYYARHGASPYWL